MKKVCRLFALLCLTCSCLYGQATFPSFGSIETDGFTTLNRYNLGWTQSIILTSIGSRGLRFDPRLTYNSFIWQKTNGQWSPVVGGGGGLTWGWSRSNKTTPMDTNLTYSIRRFRCVANDGTNEWSYEYYGFKTADMTFTLDIRLAEMPDTYPECSDSGIPLSSYGVDSAGSPTGYLLLLQGNGGGMPSLTPSNPTWTSAQANNNTRPIIYAPGGGHVDTSGSASDSNGNSISEVDGTTDIVYDTIGRPSLTISDDPTNHRTTYSYPDTSGTSQAWTMQNGQHGVESKFGCAGTTESPLASVYLPDSLSLPGGNGAYSFQYELAGDSSNPTATTGRISQITLPTGGYISFVYSGVNCDDGSPMQMTKIVNDGTTSRTTTYTRTLVSGVWKTSITTPTHSVTVSFTSNGLPSDEKTFAAGAGTSGTPLQDVAISYSVYAPLLITTTKDGISQTTQPVYDAYGNQVNRIDNDWNSTTSVLRTTHTTYFSATDYLNAGLSNLPSVQTVTVGGLVASRTEYYYDHLLADGTADSDSGNIAMTCRTGAAAHNDTDYGCSSTKPRGNLTKVVRYTNADAQTGPITTYFGYDSLGNVVQVKDARGNPSNIDYTDSWSGTSSCSVSAAFAYPTYLTDALTHHSSVAYNRCTGQPVQVQDQNSQTTSIAYSDPLLRMTGVTYPDNTTSTPSIQYSYPHTSGFASMSTEQRVFQNPETKLQTTAIDGLGRVTSVTTSDPQGDDIVATHYDAEGRPDTISNPYRSGMTPDNTTLGYDALGRRTLVTYPDGATASTMFSANAVTYGGTAAPSRTLVYDALGNLSQAQEPNPAGGSSLLTDYVADGNGNITQITQHGTSSETARQRNFAYDSLGRLLSAQVPESGITCYGQGDGTLAGCQNNGYDQNGNLLYKTDARNITISYTYDALNRLTLKTASGLANTFVYDSLPASSGVTPMNGIGRMVFETNDVNADRNFSYDPMGRLTLAQGCSPSQCVGTANPISAAYDLAGNMTSLTYPDGRSITQSFDKAGHLVNVYPTSTPGSPYVSSISYNPDGSTHVQTFGNNVQQTVTENNRLQVQTVAVASTVSPYSATPFSSQTYCYSGCTTGGSSNKGNIWGITDGRNSAKTQGFTYDALDRINSFSVGGTTNQQFTTDSFGNLSPLSGGTAVNGFSTANRINNLPCAGTLTPFDDAGNQRCDTDSYGGIRQYQYDAENRLQQVFSYPSSTAFVTYTYAADGNRVRKSSADGTYTEYVNFGGMTLAEKDQTGAWTDYVYANGKKIARAGGSGDRLHVQGNVCCGSGYTVLNPAVDIHGLVVQAGDRMAVTQFESAGTQAGVGMNFTDGTFAAELGLHDQDGQGITTDATSGQWHSRVIDLSSQAGKTIDFTYFMTDWGTTASSWSVDYRDFVYLRADGSVIPLYTGGNLSGQPGAAGGMSNVTQSTIHGGADLGTVQQVVVRFTNDSCSACAGVAPNQDRNLYVTSASVGSTTLSASDSSVTCTGCSIPGSLLSNGDMTFPLPSLPSGL